MPCTHAKVAEPVYLLSDEVHRKRVVIGEVAYCYKCPRAVGDVRKTKDCPRQFNETSWQAMLRNVKAPPFYFVLRGGLVVPEGMPEAALEDLGGDNDL